MPVIRLHISVVILINHNSPVQLPVLTCPTCVGSSVHSGAQSWHVTCMEYMVSVLVQVPVVSEMHEQWHP